MIADPQPILLDSNAYFRLARSIRPLLKGSFGHSPRYTLFIIEALAKEYNISTRLKTKFEWVQQKEYQDDRAAKRLPIPRKKKSELDTAISYLAKYSQDEQLNVSLADIKALAAGLIMSIPVVTDDGPMTKLAEAHGIQCWSTVKLLKLMHNSGHVDDAKVKEILEYWNYENDLPLPLSKFRDVFKTYFGTDCPIQA